MAFDSADGGHGADGVDAPVRVEPAAPPSLLGLLTSLRASSLYSLLALLDSEKAFKFHGTLAVIFIGMLWLEYSLAGVAIMAFVVAALANAAVVAVNKISRSDPAVALPVSVVVDGAATARTLSRVWMTYGQPVAEAAAQTLRLENWEGDARVVAFAYVMAGIVSSVTTGAVATGWIVATALCVADNRFSDLVTSAVRDKVTPALSGVLVTAYEGRRHALNDLAAKVPPLAIAGVLLAIASVMLLGGGFVSLLWFVWCVAALVTLDTVFIATANVLTRPPHAHAE